MDRYKAGDWITIEIGHGDAENLNGNRGALIHHKQVINHAPKPFDWADVKPGMAFKDLEITKTWIYSGAWIRREASGEYTTKESRGFFQSLSSLCDAQDINFKHLTRCPEYDIEVRS